MTSLVTVVAEGQKPGILETLSPVWLIVAGILLLCIAGLAHWINVKKMEDSSFILDFASLLMGFGGIFALFRGIFGDM